MLSNRRFFMHRKSIFKTTFFSVSLSLFWQFGAFAGDQEDIFQFFQEFEKNPVATMNSIPKKETLSGAENAEERFSIDDVRTKKFVIQKDKVRLQLLAGAQSNKHSVKAEYLANDNPRDLLDDPSTFVGNLATIDNDPRHLESAALPFQPWSDSYWPLYKGSVAFRYADPMLEDADDLDAIAHYVTNTRSAQMLVNAGRTDELSPAEKYDLLMNDPAFSLTHATLEYLQDKNAKHPIQGWEGICHGWAPVSYLYNRPVRTVSVYNANGVKINFFPSDIKALSSLIWAGIPSHTKFVGGRCNEENPQTDHNGRIISQDCFDSNPGTVHLALVNQLGMNQKGFVFDASYDYMVWNQPVLSYSYKYFNVKTKYVAKTAADARVPISNYYEDPFHQYRSSKAVYLVGVQLRLNYVFETRPSTSHYDSPDRDAVKSVVYYYDLELDQYGNVVGGEWYQNAHPDFMWTPASNADVTLNAIPYNGSVWAYNYGRYTWVDTPRSPYPQWTYYAQEYSQADRLPLDNVVKNLAAWASVSNGATPELCAQPCVPQQYRWHK